MNLKHMFLEETEKFKMLGHSKHFLENASCEDLRETLGQEIIEYLEFDKKILISDLKGVRTFVRKNKFLTDEEVLNRYLTVIKKHTDGLAKYISNNTLLS